MMSNDLRERMLQAIRKAWAENPKPAGSRIDRQMADALADAAIAEMGGVKVKPLVWVDTSQSFLGERYSAQTIFGVEYVILWDDRAITWSGFIWGQWTDYGDEGGFQKAKAAAQADHEARILPAIEPAPVSVQEPNMDYCYNRNDWESTFGWDDRDMLVENMLPGEVMEVGTLQQGPTLWVVEHENSVGDRETRWFDNEADARALAEGQDDDT